MIGYSMKFFIFFFQSFYNMDGFLNAWFKYIYLLEATHQPLATGKVTVVFLVSSRADETDVSAFQIGFQHVGCIHGTVSCTSGTYQIVYLVDIDDGTSFITNTFHNVFQAFFKVTPVLRTCQ